MSHIKIMSLVVVVALLGAAACAGCLEDDEGTAAKTSLTEIRVADMPTEDFRHVNVSFTEVLLHSNETGWESIEANRTIDLLYLHENNLSEQLGLEEIAVANYTKLWLVVDNATGVLADTGETVYFEVPSGTLKIQHLFALQEGNTSITLDIDLGNSIFALGDMYKLLPVISGLNVSYANGTQIHIRDRDRIKNMTQNRPPVVDIVANGTRGKHLSAVVNESIMFNAGGSFDVDNDSLMFTWDFDDGTDATGPVVDHIYNETGAYQVTLTVSDGENSSTGHLTVTVKKRGGPLGGNGNGPAPFTVDILVNGTAVPHITVDVNESILFNASGDYNGDSENLTFFWDFDDGTNATNSSVEHSYDAAGAYRIVLTVTDGESSDTAAVTVTVHKEKGRNGPHGPHEP